jgi:alkylation response protein AidB-like acyl-CoA dehydrogenase
MDFDFSEEQYLLRDTVRDFLRSHCDARQVRAMWEDPVGRSPDRWRRLGDLGVLGLCLPTTYGGSGLSDVDMVLVLEEAGRAALPEPLLEHAVLGGPLLASFGSEAQKAQWLPRLASGEATATVGLASQPYVLAADADLVLLERDGAWHALTQDRLTLTPQRSVDRARRLFAVVAETGEDTIVCRDPAASRWAFDRAVAGTAALLVGVAGHLLETTVAYVQQREQFGRRIGSFQAVQHKLAETLLLVDSARNAVYYAAYAVAHDLPDASIAASVAKAAAGDAARRANYEALQLHGGIGFTWEHDLHLWLKRGVALELQYGDADWHRRRVAEWIYSRE